MNVLHGKTMSSIERERLSEAGLKRSSEVFKKNFVNAEPISNLDWTVGMKRIVELSKWFAKKLQGNTIHVQFINSPDSSTVADYKPGFLRFNVANQYGTDFQLEDGRNIGLVIHELAHEKGKQHDGVYRHYEEELFGRACLLIASESDYFKMIYSMP